MFKKIIFLCLLLSLGFQQAEAQRRYKHPFDFKLFNLGFLMGLNYNTYNTQLSSNVVDDGVLLKRVTMTPKAGLSLGMITNVNFSNNVNFRFVPSVSLEQRDFNYFFENDSLIGRKIEASYMNLPFLLQFKTNYFNVHRVYVVTGIQWGINMASNKKVRDDPNLLKIQQHDVSLVLGVGFNLYGERIKLSPEIRYSVGLRDLYVPEFTSHSSVIGKIYSQVLTFNINFE